MTPPEYEQLVEFLGGQFAEIDRQFAGVGRQFAEIGRQFAEIDHHFVEIDRQFAEVGRQFVEVGRRFDQTDGQIADVRHEVRELRQEMLGHFDEIYRRLERLEQEYYAIVQALRRIEARLTDESGRREILARDLAELKQHVAMLQSRIEDIEQNLGR